MAQSGSFWSVDADTDMHSHRGKFYLYIDVGVHSALYNAYCMSRNDKTKCDEYLGVKV